MRRRYEIERAWKDSARAFWMTTTTQFARGQNKSSLKISACRGSNRRHANMLDTSERFSSTPKHVRKNSGPGAAITKRFSATPTKSTRTLKGLSSIRSTTAQQISGDQRRAGRDGAAGAAEAKTRGRGGRGGGGPAVAPRENAGAKAAQTVPHRRDTAPPRLTVSGALHGLHRRVTWGNTHATGRKLP